MLGCPRLWQCHAISGAELLRMMADIPVMVLVGQQAMRSFSLNLVQIDDPFEKLLDYFGPKSWNE